MADQTTEDLLIVLPWWVLSLKEYVEIRLLHRIGCSVHAISHLIQRDRVSVRKMLVAEAQRIPGDGGASEEDWASPANALLALPALSRRHGRRRSILEPHKPFLAEAISRPAVCSTQLLVELQQKGYKGSKRTLQRFLRANRTWPPTNGQQEQTGPRGDPQRNQEWMRLVLQAAVDSQQTKGDLSSMLSHEDTEVLLKCVRTKPLRLRNRALAVLAHAKGICPGQIAAFLCIDGATVRSYLSAFKKAGIRGVFDLSRKAVRKAADKRYAEAIFRTLHTPPSGFGYNRTTWRMDDLQAVLARQGFCISKVNIRKIIKNAGYRFHKARKVLTSTDPDYREKLAHVTNILRNLKPDEKFFSIDEFGPFAMKMQGGVTLTRPDQIKTIPRYQRSKGSLIMTGALELSTNQMTHFYSTKKNTAEMIRMLDLLLDRYRNQERIFFSWDAASWHSSKKFSERVEHQRCGLQSRASDAQSGIGAPAFLCPVLECDRVCVQRDGQGNHSQQRLPVGGSV